MPHKDINLWEIIIYAILAIFGSIARISSDYIQGKKTSFIELVCKIIVALFAAIIVCLTCQYFNLDMIIVAISSSLSGWMGTEIVAVFANRFKKEIEGK